MNNSNDVKVHLGQGVAEVKADDKDIAGRILDEYLEGSYNRVIHIGCKGENKGWYTFNLVNKINEDDIRNHLEDLQAKYESSDIALSELMQKCVDFGRRLGDFGCRIGDKIEN